jgi:hypothetical protein
VEVGAKLGSITVEGTATDSSIRAGRDIGKLKIGGAVDALQVSAQGVVRPTSKADLAIGSITIAGNVTNSTFLAGYDRFGNPLNSHAQIGAVSVTGNWTASSLVAGVMDVDADGFGDADDALIDNSTGPVAKIASIVITGDVTGTAGATDHFGFVAEQIAKALIKGMVQNLTAGTETIDLAGNPATNDISIREVARPAASV